MTSKGGRLNVAREPRGNHGRGKLLLVFPVNEVCVRLQVLELRCRHQPELFESVSRNLARESVARALIERS
jgi:hypothetical protein